MSVRTGNVVHVDEATRRRTAPVEIMEARSFAAHAIPSARSVARGKARSKLPAQFDQYRLLPLDQRALLRNLLSLIRDLGLLSLPLMQQHWDELHGSREGPRTPRQATKPCRRS